MDQGTVNIDPRGPKIIEIKLSDPDQNNVPIVVRRYFIFVINLQLMVTALTVSKKSNTTTSFTGHICKMDVRYLIRCWD